MEHRKKWEAINLVKDLNEKHVNAKELRQQAEALNKKAAELEQTVKNTVTEEVNKPDSLLYQLALEEEAEIKEKKSPEYAEKINKRRERQRLAIIQEDEADGAMAYYFLGNDTERVAKEYLKKLKATRDYVQVDIERLAEKAKDPWVDVSGYAGRESIRGINDFLGKENKRADNIRDRIIKVNERDFKTLGIYADLTIDLKELRTYDLIKRYIKDIKLLEDVHTKEKPVIGWDERYRKLSGLLKAAIVEKDIVTIDMVKVLVEKLDVPQEMKDQLATA